MNITAEDKNNVIAILKDHPDRCRLEAAKYLHNKYRDNNKLVDILECVAGIKTELQKKTGSIMWFACKDELPPIADGHGNPFKNSISVLITDGRIIQQTTYCNNPTHGNPFWRTNLIVTHWSFINLPK